MMTVPGLGVQVHFYRATRHLTREMRQRLRKSDSVDRMSVRSVSQFILWAAHRVLAALLVYGFPLQASGKRFTSATKCPFQLCCHLRP
jgi:hypothetical protein